MARKAKLINNKKMSIENELSLYLKPKYIYVPLVDKNGKIYKHIVKEGSYVYKGDIVAYNTDTNFPIHTSVSGYVVKGTKKLITNGENVKCLVIENDFKEKYKEIKGIKKKLNKYTKEEFINLLKENSLLGMSGSNYPTYLKYSTNNTINTLIVNAVECEPYITSDYILALKNVEDILEYIDAILEIMNIDKAIIGMKSTNIELYNEFSKFVGTYPNINLALVEDVYPSGWERKLVMDTTGIKYNKYPIEKGIIVNNISTIYAIGDILKYNRPVTMRIVTFTGENLKNPQNVMVKVGTLISEVIEFIGGYKDISNSVLVMGGPMSGISVSSDNVIISKELNCVLVIDKNNMKPKDCIHCSKCSDICPSFIAPVLIKDYIGDKNMLRKLSPERCSSCGLCSYICPSKIEVRNYVRDAITILKGSGK